ncbi:sigma-70 family RNA polymerase sigma factor [Streptomyces sp. NPDC056485]|uniref:sigma-70 family RNA polymerase sigma factor n=1 Tax=Streptomyces sp. NPDC056485 TaxID=3345834 RepID=UPI0036B7848D
MTTTALTRPDTGRMRQVPPSAKTADTATTATAAQLEEIEALHGLELYRYCVSLTRGNPVSAEEIKQETLIRAWKNPKAMRQPGYPTFRPWLFTVARRISIDLERARRARPQECDQEVLTLLPAPECGYERILDVDMVRMAIRNLPEAQRDVVICLHFKSMSSAETAEALGIPKGTVKSRAFYALKTLERTLTRLGYQV